MRQQGVIPDNQKVQRVIDRAWYVASEGDKREVSARDANDKFRSENINVNAPSTLEAGLNLTKFETKLQRRLEYRFICRQKR